MSESNEKNDLVRRAETSMIVSAPVDVVFRRYREARRLSAARSVVTQEIPSSLLAWKTVEGAENPHEGRAWFSGLPDDRGTLIRVEIVSAPPAVEEIENETDGRDPAVANFPGRSARCR